MEGWRADANKRREPTTWRRNDATKFKTIDLVTQIEDFRNQVAKVLSTAYLTDGNDRLQSRDDYLPAVFNRLATISKEVKTLPSLSFWVVAS